MNKGDLFTVYMDGTMTTVCVIGSYKEEYSGEEMVILAIVSQENMFHIPREDFEVFFPKSKLLH